jgi:DNA mismatch repair protein MutS
MLSASCTCACVRARHTSPLYCDLLLAPCDMLPATCSLRPATCDMDDVTPIRKQYLRLKAQHPDAILFFRLGDFYETFDADAEIAARELDLFLTSRPVAKGVRVPMAGVPYHAVEHYIARLIEKGYRVAIAEQVGEVTGKGLVEREVVRVVTPGTVVEPALLDARRPNYLAALVLDEDRAGLAYAEITTGEFATTQLAREEVPRELARLQPRECLFPDAREWKSAGSAAPPLPDLNFPGIHFTPYPAYRFEPGTARQALLDHFGVTTLEGFGCEGKPLAVRAAGAILQYLQETQKGALAQLTTLRTYSTDRFLVMDPTTRRNLELTESLRERRVQGSLLGVLDRTLTPMGGRLLRARIAQPLVDREAIERRLDEVERFVQDGVLRARVREALKDMPDLERLVNRVVGGIATPRDLTGIRRALEGVARLTSPHPPAPLPSPDRRSGEGRGWRRSRRGRGEAGPLPRRRRPHRPRHRGRPSGVPLRWRRHPPRFLRRTGRPAPLRPGGQRVAGLPGTAGTGADRHQKPEGRLQQSLRLLH